MKYGIIFVVSIMALILSAGNLLDGGNSTLAIVVTIASLIGCIYSEYKLGWLNTYGEQ